MIHRALLDYFYRHCRRHRISIDCYSISFGITVLVNVTVPRTGIRKSKSHFYADHYNITIDYHRHEVSWLLQIERNMVTRWYMKDKQPLK